MQSADISRQTFSFLFGYLLWSSQKILEESCLHLFLYSYCYQVKRSLSCAVVLLSPRVENY